MGGGGGGQVTGYNYQAALIIGVCEGPVSGTGVVWKDKERTTLAALGLSLYPGDATPAAPWGYLSSYHPQEAIRYPGLAYVCAPLFSLGSSADVPNLTFEVVGPGRLAGFADAQPDYIITDFIKNSRYGAAASFSLGSLTSYGDYCRAMGLFISPAFTEQKEAAEYLREIAQCTNSEYVWSQGVLNLIPYADAPVSGNGYSYTPDITPKYDLTDDDFCTTDEDPIKCSRITTADAYNHVQVEFVNRNKDYNVEIADAKDQADIEAKGLRTKDPVKLHYICEPSVARIVAQSLLQRELYVRNSYQFRLSWKHCLLEPMDLVTITDTGMGLDKLPVRIREIEEDEDGYLTVTADEWPFGVGTISSYPHQGGLGYVPNYQVAPGDSHTPTVFEPPFRLTDNSLEVWLATSGGDNWGGCQVWVSRDGATYNLAGTITGGHRHGTIVDTLATGGAVDTVNTLRVGLLDAARQLQAATQQEADELRTLMWVDGELISYRTAALVSTGVYDLTYLVRGAHNSVIGPHNAGARWARLDGGLFRVPFTPPEIGRTIHIKLCSYNVYGVALQTLDEVSAQTYTITGYARTRLPVDITAPATPTVTTVANNVWPYTGHIMLSWTAVSGITKYRVRYKKSTDTQWKEAPVASGTTWKSPEIMSGDIYDLAVASEDEQGYLSTWTAAAQTTVPYDATAPATPGVLNITPGIGYLYIQWPPNIDPDLAGYELQIAPNYGGSPGPWSTVYSGPSNSHTFRGTPGVVYWARVRAYDKYPVTPKYSAYNGQAAATVDFVKAMDSANIPSGYNLVINSDFDNGLDGWTQGIWGSSRGDIVSGVAAPKTGKYAVQNTGAVPASAYSSKPIPVQFDRTFIVEGYFSTVISGTAGGCHLAVRLLDSAGANITGDGPWWFYAYGGQFVPSNYDMEYCSGLFGYGTSKPFPVNARYMQIGYIFNASGGNRVFQAQGLRIREIIESLYIRDLSVTDGKILSCSVGKLTSGSIVSQSITLAITEGAGDVKIQAGKNDFGDTTSGFILGMDDSDGNRVKFEIGDATKYLKWDGNGNLTIRGALHADDIIAGGIRGINVNAGSHSTRGSFLTQSISAGATTVYIHNTADFPSAGSGWIIDSINDRDEISWTGKIAGALTGVTGALAHNAGASIIPQSKCILIDDNVNEIRFYGDRGDTIITEVASIGRESITTPYGVSSNILVVGGSTTTTNCIYAECNNTASVRYAIVGNSSGYGGVGVAGIGNIGVSGAGTYKGVEATCNGEITGIALYARDLTNTTEACGVSSRADTGYGVYSAGGRWDFYAAGAGPNYGPFTGSHEGLVPKSWSACEGDILVDLRCVERANISNTICENTLSDRPRQCNVIGVYVTHGEMSTLAPPSALWDKSIGLPNPRIVGLSEIFDVVVFNAVGEGQINVCKEGGNIQIGDFICSSSRPGKGMRQDDDIQHSYTVAKAREDCIWQDDEDDVRLIACTYHCG